MKKIFTKAIAALLPALLVMGAFASQASAAAPDDSTPRMLVIHNYPEEGIRFAVVKAYSALEQASAIADAAGALTTASFSEKDDAGYSYLLAHAADETKQVTTSALGTASWGYDAGAGLDGIYYVIELPDSRVAVPAAPFRVSVPAPAPGSAEDWLYEVHVYPKKGQLELKQSFADGSLRKSAAIGSEIGFKVTVGIPNGIGGAAQFTLQDVMPDMFTFKPGSVSVALQNDGGVVAGSNYTPALNEGLNTLRIDFMPGLAFLAEHEGDKLVVTFAVTLNAMAAAGSAVNSAALLYNNLAPISTSAHEEPELFFNAVVLDKVDVNDAAEKLAGAKFQVASSQAKADAGQFLRKGANGAILDTGDLGYGAAAVWEETSGADGAVIFGGLAYDLHAGTAYWLVETQAPAGYNQMRGAFSVLVKGGTTSYSVGSFDFADLGGVTPVQNDNGFALPLTGGPGLIAFSCIGIGLMSGAVALLSTSYRRRKKERLAAMSLY